MKRELMNWVEAGTGRTNEVIHISEGQRQKILTFSCKS